MSGTFDEFDREVFEIPLDLSYPSAGEEDMKNLRPQQLQVKLKCALAENQSLKSQLSHQEQEIHVLKKKNHELEAQVKMASQSNNEPMSLHSPQVAQTIVQLKKKNRDLTCQVESMKTKMQQLMNQNEHLKDRVEELEKQQQDSGTVTVSKSTEEILNAAAQLTQTTNKMMEYRRQCQQLKIEHRAALRALAQEIGDENINHKNVLGLVGNPSWRGRQQQILNLNQKVVELQNRLTYIQVQQEKQQQYQIVKYPMIKDSRDRSEKGDHHSYQDQTYNNNEDDGSGSERSHNSQGTYVIQSKFDAAGNQLKDSYNYEREIHMERLNSGHNANLTSSAMVVVPLTASSSSASQRHLADLHLQDKRKREQFEKLKEQLEETKKELIQFQQERKAFKARTHTLENQVKSYRLEIDDLDCKLKEKEYDYKNLEEELITTRKELNSVKIREQNLIENNSMEMYEIQQSLARERSMVVKLQSILDERQELVQKMDVELKRLQHNLDVCCNNRNQFQNNGRPSSAEIASVIKNLKSQVHETALVIKEYEKERQGLLTFTEKLVVDLEDERIQHTDTKNRLIKSFTVIDEANNCITICTDESKIVNKKTLEHVEAIRALVREIKATGNLYSLDTIPTDDLQKLKRKVSLLCKENGVLHQHAKKSLDDRRRDLEQYSTFAAQLRNEFLNVLHSAMNSYKV